jgi:anti-sigma factor RsiW
MVTAKRSYRSRSRSCKKITDLILNHLTGRLSPALKREFERHLRICPDCVSFLNTYKNTVALTGSLDAREIPQNVRKNVLAFLRRRMRDIAMFVFSLLAHAIA